MTRAAVADGDVRLVRLGVRQRHAATDHELVVHAIVTRPRP
ncbi:hypothetical protein AB0368_30815 [Actinoplanes sp. NPDC051475]